MMLDRRIWLIAGLTLGFVGADTAVFTYLAIYLVGPGGFGLGIVGAAYLLKYLFRALASPLAGALSDRWGRRKTAMASAAATAVTLAAFPLVGSAAALLAWASVQGFAAGGVVPVLLATIIDVAPVDRRQSALSVNYAALSIGYTLGVAPAGAVPVSNIPELVFIGAVVNAVVALLVLLVVRGAGLAAAVAPPFAAANTAAPGGRSRFLANLQGPFRDPAFWGFAAVALVFPLGIGLLANGAPVYLASRGLDDRTIGMVLAVNGMLLGALSLPANRALEKRGPFLLLPLAALFVAASLGALGISASAWAFFAAVLVFSAGELLFSSALPTAVSRLSPPDRRGAYQGAWSMVYSLMVGAALAVLSLLRASLDWGSTWLLLGGFAIVAGFALLLARRAFSATIAARSAAQGATPAAHGTRPPT